MIGYLRGTVTYLFADYCLLDVSGVGYRVFIAASTRSKLKMEEEVTLFTYLSVREDAMLLYGFYSAEEYDVFQQLISVSGVGPRVALGILSAISVEKLCRAIHQEQLSILTKLPGIGKKTAGRLILELKDKVKSSAAEDQTLLEDEFTVSVGTDCLSEASAALLALGYTQAEIEPVLQKAAKKAQTVEEIIKYALQEFAGRR